MIKKGNLMKQKRAEALTAYAMLLPDIVGLLFFVFVPIVYAFFVSLNDWNGLKAMKYIGLKNYAELVHSTEFWDSIIITLKYVIIYVPAVFCIALLLALLVNAIQGRMQTVLRMLFFFPFSISTIVASIIWIFMYDPKKGYINSLLSLFGIEKQDFLASTTQALVSVAAVGVWLIVGYTMIIFLAALKDIPRTYYEAADIDGVNVLQRFHYITFPMIRETSLFVAIVTTISSFQVFDQIKVMTGGGPALSTNVTVYYIYQQAFEIFRFGYASSIAFVLFAFIMVLTLVQLKSFSGDINN